MTNGRDKTGAQARGEAVSAPRREPRSVRPEPRATERGRSYEDPNESRRGNRSSPDARARQSYDPAPDSRHARYPEPDSRQARYPDTDSQRARYPAPDSRKARYPEPDSRRARYPEADSRKARYPDTDSRQARYPDTDSRHARYPAPDSRQARYPDTDSQRARYPEPDSRRDTSRYGGGEPDKPPRRKRRRRRRRGSLLLLYLFLIFIGVAAGAILSLTVFFRIDAFAIKGQSRYSDAEILGALTIRQGDNLLRINKEKAAASVLDKLPYAGAVNIRRGFPSTLIVEVKEAVPKYVVSADGALYLADGNFRVLEAVREPGGELLLKGLKTRQPRPGRTLEMTDKLQGDRLRALLAELQAQSLEGVTEIDVGDKTAIKMLYDRRIILQIGTTSGLQRKITAAKRIITGEIPADKTGTLDLSRVDDEQFTAPFREHILTN